MVFADWTFSGDDNGSLDAATKHAGNSSYRGHLVAVNDEDNYLTHDTFSEPQATVILWVRRYRSSSTYDGKARTYVKHSAYGDVQCVYDSDAYDTWEKHRVTFWYDIGSNIKFGRDERYVGGAWVETGNDVNHGAGSPSAGSIALHTYGYHGYTGITVYCWFDEVEVSA